MLQNDKINCNGSFRDITMHFVTDPCVNVSILWIIIMYHVKPSCCTTPKIHWDMSNFFWCTQKHLERLWCGSGWQWSRRMAVALLPCSGLGTRGATPQPCPHTAGSQRHPVLGQELWHGTTEPWAATQPPGHTWVPVTQAEVTGDNLLTENPNFQMAPTAMEQLHQIHELEARQKPNQKPPPLGTQLNQGPAPEHR